MHQRAAQAVRVEVGQAGGLERITEDPPDGSGAAPVLSCQAGDLELARRANDHVGGREHRVVKAALAVVMVVVLAAAAL